MCPSQVYVVLPQWYSISRFWEELVCRECVREDR
ncbi:rCG63715 [Rattus norvegicus]|uniref:RCG63715 n=1 Tax=Rattus norvegicus TaxID=10116 RepID=A6IA28_RAT|nr:rCG63715 [Rattus norvegicus]